MTTMEPRPSEARARARALRTDAGDAPFPEQPEQLMLWIQQHPEQAAAVMMQQRQQHQAAVRQCSVATDAAKELEGLFEQLLEGNAQHLRVETVRDAADGPRAVCRNNGQFLEVSIHPDIDPDLVRDLEPWDYACVREQVLVDLWRDDPVLFEMAHGEVVEFKGYLDDEGNLVRVARSGGLEEVVSLAPPLRERPLPVHCRLVLLRDNPRWAIACVGTENVMCRFEVPVDSIETRLTDLACIEPLAAKMIGEVVKRLLRSDIRDEFRLDPIRGITLWSYKPGMGKTAFMRAFARWLHDLGQKQGFDVVLYLVKPNELKSMWHGEDARIVREDLFGAMRHRREQPRDRALIQLLVLDEVDSIGHRSEQRTSSAATDALEALMVELDGMQQSAPLDPPAHLMVVGMTNRPQGMDDALKRTGRLGDLTYEMPDVDADGAARICGIYLPGDLPWHVDGEIVRNLTEEQLLSKLLLPAVRPLFETVVLHYATESQRQVGVTAGQIMANAHYRAAMNVAKNRAADRRLHQAGIPAVDVNDVVEGLVSTALSVARQMEADPAMLIRHLKIKVPVTRVDAMPREAIEVHPFGTPA